MPVHFLLLLLSSVVLTLVKNKLIISKMKVVNSIHLGDWKSALEIQGSSATEYNTVLWIQPAKEDLEFIKDAVTSRGLKSLTSVGCGSGFLEWLIHSATRKS